MKTLPPEYCPAGQVTMFPLGQYEPAGQLLQNFPPLVTATVAPAVSATNVPAAQVVQDSAAANQRNRRRYEIHSVSNTALNKDVP